MLAADKVDGRAAYDQVAHEYYDRDKHPTCHDFRRSTKILLEAFLKDAVVSGRPAIELGAGKSLVAELYALHGYPLAPLWITDSSGEMLRYSAAWTDWGATLALFDAREFRVQTPPFDLMFSCLGDPYNESRFWTRAANALVKGGLFFYSTPSFEWSQVFRRDQQHGITDAAEFTVSDGARILVPSTILPIVQQTQLIESAGFSVRSINQVLLRDIANETVSPKLHTRFGDRLPIVTAFVAKKN